jgi:hypothetical protein
LISMNQHKRTFVRRSTASKGRSLHQNARSRKRVSLHMVWSQAQQCDHIFVINFIPLLRNRCGTCALMHSNSAIPVQWHQRNSGFYHARVYHSCRVTVATLAGCSPVGPVMDWTGTSQKAKYNQRLGAVVGRHAVPI